MEPLAVLKAVLMEAPRVGLRVEWRAVLLAVLRAVLRAVLMEVSRVG